MWVPEFLDDIEIDILRFFPQLGADPLDLPAPLFFKICLRLVVYGGALAAAVAAEAPPPPTEPAPRSAPSVDPGDGLGPLVSGIRAPKGAKVVTFAEMASEHPDLIGFQRVAG